jgi:ubiquinone/menaquinone biosynthesis C-methylase UbiE
MTSTKDLIERQYRDKKLNYSLSFPGLRKLFRRLMNTRHDVARYLIGKYSFSGKVLDLGCGDGGFIIENHESFDRCVGIDISPFRINQANESVQKLPKYIQDKFEFLTINEHDPLPCKPGEYDAAISLAVLQWVNDMYGLMGELRTAVKDGGMVMVECMNLAYFKQRIRIMMGQLPQGTPSKQSQWPEIGWDAGCLHHFTKKTFRIFLEQNGFEVVELCPTGFFNTVTCGLFPGLFATGWVAVIRKPV